ncbi:MAG: phosphoribosylglycinamide formyltransferase [Firmicutes bacterium]|nr:phosphoribosylglycinamide formyltransferase [Bacillota bacterium]
MRARLAVFASGAGTHAQALIEACRDGRLAAEIVLVLSDRPEAPALDRARAAGVPSLCVARRAGESRSAYDRRLLRAVLDARADFVVLAGFMRLLGRSFVQALPWRVLNIHPSLLPAFPGLDAPARALAHGVRYTGCTVHFVDEGMDSGPIIHQAVVPVRPDDTVETLTARIKAAEYPALLQALQWAVAGRLRVEGRRVVILDELEGMGT